MQYAEDRSYAISPADVEIHPAANTVRMMDTNEYTSILEDIREQGQLVPAVLLDGLLIDGRNRMKACAELGIELRVEDHIAEAPDPARLVWSYNAARRQLTKGQKAALASDMANLEKHNNASFGGVKVRKSDSSQKTITKPVTQQEAAETFGVDSSQLRKFRLVEKENPVEAQRVRLGEIGVEAAYKKVSKAKKKPAPKQEPAPVTPITPQTVQNDVDVMAEAVAAIPQLPDNLESAMEDFTNPLYMLAFSLKESEDELKKHLGLYGRQDRKRMLGTLAKIMEHQQKLFDGIVSTQLPKYNKDLQEKLKAELATQRETTKGLQRLAKEKFGKNEYRQIVSALHPDREASSEKREAALAVFQRLEPLFR